MSCSRRRVDSRGACALWRSLREAAAAAAAAAAAVEAALAAVATTSGRLAFTAKKIANKRESSGRAEVFSLLVANYSAFGSRASQKAMRKYALLCSLMRFDHWPSQFSSRKCAFFAFSPLRRSTQNWCLFAASRLLFDTCRTLALLKNNFCLAAALFVKRGEQKTTAIARGGLQTSDCARNPNLRVFST